jgi:hypothetical protein
MMPRAGQIHPDKIVESIETFDSRKQLACCDYPGLHRQIGVRVSLPFHHMGRNAQHMECDYETICINTKTFGSNYALDEVPEEINRMTLKIVEDIDVVVRELLEHRKRLLTTIDPQLLVDLVNKGKKAQ